MRQGWLPFLASVVLLTACDVKIGNDAGDVAENASADGRAEDGKISIEAPGFNMSVNIPDNIRADAGMDQDGLIYPGSKFGGIHIQGGREHGDGKQDGEVELRFASGDPINRVLAWYRDGARDKDITIAVAERRGDGFLVSGTVKHGDGRFAVNLAPRRDGGTDARLLISDRN